MKGATEQNLAQVLCFFVASNLDQGKKTKTKKEWAMVVHEGKRTHLF